MSNDKENTQAGHNFKFFDPKELKAYGRIKKNKRPILEVAGSQDESPKEKKTRGSWTDNRDNVVLIGYEHFRPISCYRGRAKKWNKLVDYVNKLDKHVAPVKKQASVNRFYCLIDMYKPFFKGYKNNKHSGSNCVNPETLKNAYVAFKALEEDENATRDEREKKDKELEERDALEQGAHNMCVIGNPNADNKGKQRALELLLPEEESKQDGEVVDAVEGEETLQEYYDEVRNDQQELMNLLRIQHQETMKVLLAILDKLSQH